MVPNIIGNQEDHEQSMASAAGDKEDAPMFTDVTHTLKKSKRNKTPVLYN